MAQAATAGTYGSFAIDAAGAWTYTASTAHNEFVAGPDLHRHASPCSSADGTPTPVTVNIPGTNDAAVLIAPTANLTETNAVLTTSGTLTISDVDSAATFVAQTGRPAPTAALAIEADGDWTYTASTAHNEFVAGTDLHRHVHRDQRRRHHHTVTVNIPGPTTGRL